MLPIANLHIRTIYDAAVEFFVNSSASSSRAQSPYDSSAPNSPYKKPTNPDQPSRGGVPLRERLDAACHSPTSSLAGLSPTSMRRELDITKHELAKSQTEAARLQERCKMLEKTLKETREMLRTRDSEVDKLRREKERERLLSERRRSDVGPQYQPQRPKDLHPRHSSLDIRNSGGTSSSSQPLQIYATNGHSAPNEADELLLASSEEEEASARTRSTETFTTRTDAWSGAQVLQAVHDINSEILQFAAAATELCSFDRDSWPSSARSVQAMHDTSSRIGQNFARILSNRDHSLDPTLVQLALQGCVTMCISRALSSFCIGFPAKADLVLSRIYSHMIIAEPQPTSSKWRALTHRSIHAMNPAQHENAVAELSESILRWSSDIFIVAGSQSYDSRDGLRTRFGEQVRRICRAVLRLARVTREDIMSTCFDVVAVDQGEVFDPAGMRDAFGECVSSRGLVLSTLELGLRCSTRKRDSQLTKADDAILQQRLLLPPKVILESVMDALDGR